MRDAGLNLQALFGINPGSSDFYGVLIPNNGSFDIGASEFVVPEPSLGIVLGSIGLALSARRRRSSIA